MKPKTKAAFFLGFTLLCARQITLTPGVHPGLDIKTSAEMVPLKSSRLDQLAKIVDRQNSINIISNVSRDFSAMPPTETLLLLHYHKTGECRMSVFLVLWQLSSCSRVQTALTFHFSLHLGHELCRKLATHALGCNDKKNSRHCKFFRLESRAYTVETVVRFVNKKSKNLAVLPANLELVALSDWKDVFPYNPSTKVIHFIRDPFELLSSAYVYHAQSSIPPLERHWINEPQTDPCNSAHSEQMYDLATSIQGGKAISIGEVNQLTQLCLSMYAAPNNETRLWTRLQKVDYKEGLLLTALGYLTKDRPQLLMMWKALQLSRTVQDQVYTTVLSQWTKSYDLFHQSALQICQMAKLSVTNQTVEDCVEKAVEHAYINVTSTNHSHVMSNRVSESERETHTQFLMEHRLLGPILRRLQASVWKIWKDQFLN